MRGLRPPHTPRRSGLLADRQLELPGRPGKSQKEGQEDQGEVKELGGTPLGLLGSPGPPGLPSGSSLASLELHQTSLRTALPPGRPGQSQKEGQDDQGTLKALGGSPLALLLLPDPPGLPSGSSLASLELHHGIYF